MPYSECPKCGKLIHHNVGDIALWYEKFPESRETGIAKIECKPGRCYTEEESKKAKEAREISRKKAEAREKRKMIRYCEVCKQEIDPERAEFLPDTRLCTEHAKAIEKFGGEFVVTGTQSSLSKTGSLKKNYGDVGVEKKRNQEAIDKLKEELEGR